MRRYDVSNSYISEVAQEATDTANDNGIQLISYKKLSTESGEGTTELEEEGEGEGVEGENNTSNGKRSTNQLQQVSAHPGGIHSYDLLACNV